MNDESTNIKLAIQRLEQSQVYSSELLGKISESLTELITLQKSHEIFHEKVTGELKSQKEYITRSDARINKMEVNQTWAVRLLVSAVLLKLLSLIWSA